MPDRFASQISGFRADSGFSPRVYMSVYAPQPIVTAEVTVIAPEPMKYVVVTVTTGAWADIRAGMRIVVRAPTGEYKGETRIRFGNTLTSTVFHIRETSSGYINIEVGDIVTVFPFIPLDAKLVAADQTFSPDGTPAGTFGGNPPPLVCSGGHSARWVDGYRSAAPAAFGTVTTDGSNTRNVDPDSTPGNVTHAWTFLVTAGAAFQTGSAATNASPVLELNTGLHFVQHAVTDNNNSVVASQYTVHMVHGASFLPYEVLLPTPPQGDADTGWSWEVEFLDEADLDAVPDGALCILWADEWINGTQVSYRSAVTGRSHILGIGYARRDRSSGDGDEGDTLTMEIQSAMARLKELAKYSSVMEENASPDAWNEIKTLGFERGITQIWQFYTTGTESGVDLVTHALFNDARYPAHYLDRSDPITGMTDLARARRGRIAERERGAIIELQPHPGLLDFADRASVTIGYTLTDDDVFSYESPREHFDSTEIFELQGITAGASGNTAVYSRAPGLAPAGGLSYVVQQKASPDSQTTANIESALWWALYESLFYDPDNNDERHRVGELTLRMPGVYNVLDFNVEYQRFQYAGSLRGIDFTNYRYYLKRVTSEVDPDSGEWVAVQVWQPETYALPGASYFPPSDGNGLPGSGFPDFSFPITLPRASLGLVAGMTTIRGINEDGFLYTTTNFEYPEPTWAREDIGEGNILDSVQSAFVPTRQIIVTATATDAIFTVDDIGGTMVATAVKSLRAAISNTTAQWRMIDASFGADYMVVVSFYGNSGADTGTWETHSLDGGDTWSAETNITAHYGEDSGGGQVPGLFVSSRSPGVAYLGAYTTSGDGAAGEADIYKLTGTFGSPTAQSVGASDITARTIHRSWADSENTMFFTSTDFSLSAALRARIWRKIGAAARVDVTPSIGGNNQGLFYTRGLHTCPLDAQTVLAAVAGNTTGGVVMSRNQGTTWTQISEGTTAVYNGAEVAGNSRDVGYVWGDSGAIGLADLRLGTIVSKMGNLLADFPSIGRFVRLRGA